MDSVSRARPNLHYGEDWTYQLQEDTPLKKLMEPDPQMQTGEWLLHSGELQDTEDQFHRRTREPEIERLRDIRLEPEKRADHRRRSAMERSQVMAKSQEAGRREARSRSISHWRNLSASWDQDSPTPPPAPVVREEKELHSVARNKVVTNPRAKSIPRNVKDVARSPACRRMNTNLREPYTPPKVPMKSPPPPPPRGTREEKVNPGRRSYTPWPAAR